MEYPDGCPDAVCDVMRRCWIADIEERSTAADVEEMLRCVSDNRPVLDLGGEEEDYHL